MHALLARNIQLAKTNLEILSKFIEQHSSLCKWTKPVAGTTAFVKFLRDGRPVDDERFCLTLQQRTGVMLAPGKKCFGEGVDFKGYVRIGFVCETKVLQEGLKLLKGFLVDDYPQVPHAE